jgi:hypothetical protein
MSLATVIRMEFSYPGVGILAGDSIQYLSIATAHGVIMVFFMVMPAIFGAFGNFLLHTQLGVHDVAFPRLNSAAFWFLPGGLIMLCQLVCVDRRYQRMNCFNIRELQGILKRKFFTDLVNTSDSHKAIDSTLINMRHKNNMSNILLYDQSLFYNFDLTNTSKYKNYNFNPGKIYTYSSSNNSPLNLLNLGLFIPNLHITLLNSFKGFIHFISIPDLTTLMTLFKSFSFVKISVLNTLYINVISIITLPYGFTNNNIFGKATSVTVSNTTNYKSSTTNYLNFSNSASYNFSDNSSS